MERRQPAARGVLDGKRCFRPKPSGIREQPPVSRLRQSVGATCGATGRADDRPARFACPCGFSQGMAPGRSAAHSTFGIEITRLKIVVSPVRVWVSPSTGFGLLVRFLCVVERRFDGVIGRGFGRNYGSSVQNPCCRRVTMRAFGWDLLACRVVKWLGCRDSGAGSLNSDSRDHDFLSCGAEFESRFRLRQFDMEARALGRAEPCVWELAVVIL